MASWVLILDVVVDEREVVQQLDRGADREDACRVAAEGLEHEAAEDRTQPLAATRPLGVQSEVVLHHPVEGLEGRLGLRQQGADLVVDRRDTRVEGSRAHRCQMI